MIFDTVTIGSVIGLIVFAGLWKFSSGKVWYYDADDDPVSLKAIFGLCWWVCIVVLINKFANLVFGFTI